MNENSYLRGHFELDPNTPGFEEFQILKKENEAIKQAIEQAWGNAGIDTENSILIVRRRQVQPAANKTVLLVDDTKSVLAVEKMAFTRAGFKVITCESGFEALDAVRSTAIDMCILDVMIPEMSGYEFLDVLTAEGLKSFPIILCTATHESGLHLEGVDDLVRKPFRAGYLVEKANRLLHQD